MVLLFDVIVVVGISSYSMSCLHRQIRGVVFRFFLLVQKLHNGKWCLGMNICPVNSRINLN